MTEARNPLTDLFAACWKDDDLKARFMSDPRIVLAEHGIELPDAIDVKVVENHDQTVHITLPVPPEGHHELSDEELTAAAGGFIVGMSMLQNDHSLGFIRSMAS